MTLKRLTSAEMVGLSYAWVKRGSPENRLLAAIPEAAPMLPRIERARAAILSAQASDGGAEAERAKRLWRELESVDDRHDGLARAVVHILEGFAHLATDRGDSTALLRLRDTLVPEGLAVTQKTYREEAAAGVERAARLSDDVQAQLAALPTPEGTLLDVVSAWQAAARRIGELEDERDTLVERVGPAGGDMSAARNQWIRAVTALEAALVLAEVDAVVADRILGRVRQAAAQAERLAAGDAPPSERPEASDESADDDGSEVP